MRIRTLDDFSDLDGWSPVASGQARLTLVAETDASRRSLCLDFDFQGGGGFAVARKPIRLDLPQSYAFLMDVRAEAPANAFEFKLVDPSGANVWRLRDDAFDFRSGWRTLRIPSRAIAFGWGPAGGGEPRAVGAIEIVVAAGPGGQGRLWIADLRLEDRTPESAPRLRASGCLPGAPPECVLDGRPETCWRPDRLPAWIELDFGEARDYGGLALRWDSEGPRGFRVLAGEDGTAWHALYRAPRSAGRRSAVYLPGGGSRWLRLELDDAGCAATLGLVGLEVRPDADARTLDDFFHRLAEQSPRGRFPRWLYREQSYWTPVDLPDGTVPALFNEEGMVEVRRAGWSVEPFLFVDGTLLTWADAAVCPGLLESPLPIPQSVWTLGDLRLTATAWASGSPDRAWLHLCYRVEDRGREPRARRLCVAIRPFQVSPPWQGWRDIGGASPVREIDWRDGALWVNGELALVPLAGASAFGAAAFDEGSVVDALAAGRLPAAQSVRDPFGYGSAALAFDLPSGGDAAVELVAPLGKWRVASGEWRADLPAPSALATGPASLRSALDRWSQVLGAVDFRLPALARDYADTCKGALAHILIDRDGPALQPGPRRYTRSWVRDGATMVAALLRLGRPEEAEAFVRWYAQFQAADGNVPCCVDDRGPDWLPEHDSHGQLCFAVAEHRRFTGDLRLARDLWPAVLKAVGYLERLRAERLTDAYRTPERLACYGLLPESVSHEGYLAHPVHAYWDDFWALRGLKDAAELAEALGESAQAERLARLRDDFCTTLHDSLARTMTDRGIDFLPGSVEWADPDPTATANALTLIDESHRLPPAVLARTFDLFMERFRAMHGEHPVPWVNYTPYEVRIAAALIRLGRRAEAHELLGFLLAERRPPVWHQWPEIAWRDPRAPGHQGDLPHAWIGAEYCLAFRDLFAYERESDGALVLGAGIPAHWLAAGAVAVRGLPTWYGTLDLDVETLADGALRVRIGGDLRVPPGGFRLVLPLAGPAREIRVNGALVAQTAEPEIRVASAPAEIRILV